MKLIKLNSSKKRSLSPIVSVILLVLVATVIAGFLLSFLKNSTHTKLNNAHVALKQASSLDCAQAEIYVDGCLADTSTKDINLLVKNNSNITLYGLSLSADGNSSNGPVRLVGTFDNIVKPGEYVNLSTGSSGFTASKETNLSNLNVSTIKNLTLSNLACPNKSIFVDTCETNMCNNDGICETGENETYCSNDCPAGCNLNGVCDAGNGESKLTCASDCICNNDGVCDTSVGETVANCSYDCPTGCNNNGTCDLANGENYSTCSADCPPVSALITTPASSGLEYLINNVVNFDASITDGLTPYTCSWKADGSVFSSTCGSTTNTFSSVGLKNIDFTATGNAGSTDTDSKTVQIYDYAAPPTANYNDGTYSSAIDVTLTPGTAGTTIIYTTDGSTPTEINGTPQGTSQIYSGPITFDQSGTYTLKAIAYNLPDYRDSTVMTKTYTLNLPLMDFKAIGSVVKEVISNTTATYPSCVTTHTLPTGTEVIDFSPAQWQQNCWVYIPANSFPTNASNSLTYVLWFYKSTSQNTNGNYITYYNSGSPQFAFGDAQGNSDTMWLKYGSAESGYNIGTFFTGQAGKWIQVVLTFNYNNCSVDAYRNGVLQNNYTLSGCIYPSASSIKYINGSSSNVYTGGNYSMTGYMNDIRVYAGAMSASDILDLYNSEKSQYS